MHQQRGNRTYSSGTDVGYTCAHQECIIGDHPIITHSNMHIMKQFTNLLSFYISKFVIRKITILKNGYFWDTLKQ